MASTALSNDYTVQQYWTEAMRDVTAGNTAVVLDFEKYNLINRSQDNVAGLIYQLGSRSYEDSITSAPNTSGRYGTTGTYTAATQLLTATMNTSFSSSDIGDLVVMRTGTTIYLGTIRAVGSTTTVNLVGDNLPSTDQAAFDTITMVPTTPSGDVLSLSGLRIMKTGQQINIELESTATNDIELMDTISLRRWNKSSYSNLNKIAGAYSGNNLYLKRGSSLASYGTLTLRYPRVPFRVSLDTDYIDLPDGTAVQLGIMNLSTLIARRANIEVNDRTKQEILMLTQSLNQMFGKQMNLALIKEKALSLA